MTDEHTPELLANLEEIAAAAVAVSSGIHSLPHPLAFVEGLPPQLASWLALMFLAVSELPSAEAPAWAQPAAQRLYAKAKAIEAMSIPKA